MAQLFDTKNFNPEVFGKYVDSIPSTKVNELIKSGALRQDSRLPAMFAEQTGSYKGSLPLYGRLSGDPDNYDGLTDIGSTTPDTYIQQFVVTGRAKGFLEKDFSEDITGGTPFMDIVGQGIAEYWDEVYQSTLLKVLDGIFNMTSTAGAEFADEHTYDISGEGETFGANTLNTALQKASGDRKSSFALAIMHSKVATDLENLQLIEYSKYTDASGITRNLAIGTINGRTVIIDDDMPCDDGKYTTYVLGQGSIVFQDVNARVPYEMERTASHNGGETTLYTRRRFVMAPDGISFIGDTATLSPTNAELSNGANWDLVTSGGDTPAYYPHKAIAIARIITC